MPEQAYPEVPSLLTHAHSLLMPQVRKQVMTTGDPGLVGFARTPLVDLPLGATEDRVCGTIDFERALMEGEEKMYGVCVCVRVQWPVMPFHSLFGV